MRAIKMFLSQVKV